MTGWRFKGTSSLGYNHGEFYQLATAVSVRSLVAISRSDGSGFCPYESWESFFENWEWVN